MKEILTKLVESTTLPEDGYLEQDPEILEIFVEEVEEIFEELDPLLSSWQDDVLEPNTLKTIRRHFHTLKGSGRMVGAMSSAEVAWSVEDTLNRCIAETLSLNEAIRQFVKTVYAIFKYKLYPDFKNVKPVEIDLRPLILIANQLQKNQELHTSLKSILALSDQLTSTEDMTGLEFALETDVTTEETEQLPIAETQIIVSKTIAEQIQQSTENNELLEIREIFVEESQGHLRVIDDFLQKNTVNEQDYNALIRAVHTLRGSSAMVHFEHVFDASSKVECLFKQLIEAEIKSSSSEKIILSQYAEFIRDYLYSLLHGNEQQQEQLYQHFLAIWNASCLDEKAFTEAENPQGLVTKLLDLDINRLLDTEFEFDTLAKSDYPAYLQSLRDQAEILMQGTLNNRATESVYHFTESLKQAYDALLLQPELLDQEHLFDLLNHLHQDFIHLFDTLASGQRVTISLETENKLQELTQFIQQDSAVPTQEIAVSEEAQKPIDFSVLAQQIQSDYQYLDSEQSNRDFDDDLLEIFLEEAEELLANIDNDVATWSKDIGNTLVLNNLMRYLHTLKGGANMISAKFMGTIAHHLETIYEGIIQQKIEANADLIRIIRLVQDNIADRIQIIREEKLDYPAYATLEILDHITEISHHVEPKAKAIVEVPPVVVETKPVIEDVSAATIIENQPVIADVQPLVEAEPVPVEEITQQIFLEEAEEILEQAYHSLSIWFDHRTDRSILLQLQRFAHSLKAGARMVNKHKISKIAYQLESTFENFAQHQFQSNAYDALLLNVFEWLQNAIRTKDERGFEQLTERLASIDYVDVIVQLPESIRPTIFENKTAAIEFVQGDGVEPPSMHGEWEEKTQVDHANEMIRISAELVEKMIDLSGENSINRSRIEVELGQIGSTLNEMELAIKRLADQLRRMEGELESQIMAKLDSENIRYEDFDPLEMDQYSSLNQLSKSLTESASDLVDFKNTLTNKIRDTESLLLQQSRIQTEIQESLMRTRLVPFSRLLPRLQRIARQTSMTVNRPTELVVKNTEGELDRTILERLVTPFEHMLRNAIDHGIEDAAERHLAGKPATGIIELNISRQGTDVVVTFKDDGRGLDIEKIRDKAFKNGLLTADHQLTDNEILQLIFHPGFSTAKQVTQISGRGVGLDIVQTEIKSLGGYVTVESSLGQGTTFIIRVPTTVAISDALMVKVGDQQFAFPLAQIERIVRIEPAKLMHYFESSNELFKIDNEHYKLRYLAEFVSNQPVPRLAQTTQALPVLLVKLSTGQIVALLVDQLVGSRNQIVVKPIGQQFSKVTAIAGATIMGDGHVCLILDAQNIARQTLSSTRQKVAMDQFISDYEDSRRRLIMIVDDSVTVRKVTSRLLERQGYDVITAKDGIDALEQLQNVKPDLMLLDIEMPRMDGFEVTNSIRHNPTHKNLPILMITSRTGEKHRERAFSLGVSDYMGKPFQEAILLNRIETMLAQSE